MRQAVGSTPFIIGTKLKSRYFRGPRYLETCIDIQSNATAARITSFVLGAITSLAIDLGFVLEGKTPEHLPEQLLGARPPVALQSKRMLNVVAESCSETAATTAHGGRTLARVPVAMLCGAGPVWAQCVGAAELSIGPRGACRHCDAEPPRHEGGARARHGEAPAATAAAADRHERQPAGHAPGRRGARHAQPLAAAHHQRGAEPRAGAERGRERRGRRRRHCGKWCRGERADACHGACATGERRGRASMSPCGRGLGRAKL